MDGGSCLVYRCLDFGENAVHDWRCGLVLMGREWQKVASMAWLRCVWDHLIYQLMKKNDVV